VISEPSTRVGSRSYRCTAESSCSGRSAVAEQECETGTQLVFCYPGVYGLYLRVPQCPPRFKGLHSRRTTEQRFLPQSTPRGAENRRSLRMSYLRMWSVCRARSRMTVKRVSMTYSAKVDLADIFSDPARPACDQPPSSRCASRRGTPTGTVSSCGCPRSAGPSCSCRGGRPAGWVSSACSCCPASGGASHIRALRAIRRPCGTWC
jgi:hypothetical protein